MVRILLFLFIFPFAAMCQITNPKGKIWLTNSRGELVGGADTVVVRKFFDAEWVRIQPDYEVDSLTEWWFVVCAGTCKSGITRFTTTEVPESVIQKIKSIKEDDAIFMLFFQPEDPDDWDPKKNMLDFRLLEY